MGTLLYEELILFTGHQKPNNEKIHNRSNPLGLKFYFIGQLPIYSHKVTNVMMKIWVPEPRNTDRSMPFLGGLKTSPWTSFHPNSS